MSVAHSLPEKNSLIGYANDIAITITSREMQVTQERLNLSMRQINLWIDKYGLQLANLKTEIVLLTRRRVSTDIHVECRRWLKSLQDPNQNIGQVPGYSAWQKDELMGTNSEIVWKCHVSRILLVKAQGQPRRPKPGSEDSWCRWWTLSCFIDRKSMRIPQRLPSADKKYRLNPYFL